MIDGLQFSVNDVSGNLIKLPFWEVQILERTGQRVNDTRTAKVNGMHLTLKPKQGKGMVLNANGSLHNWHNEGEGNAGQFTPTDICKAVESLTNILSISPEHCALHGLEIGVNIPLSCSPVRILKNAVCYKGRPFTGINKRNLRKGIIANLSQYDLKLYDKAAQSGKDCGHVLRLEIHYHKMQPLELYNIKTLSDLQNPLKLHQLKEVLINAIEGIIWTDTAANIDQMTDREQKKYLHYANPKAWQGLNKFKAARQRKTAAALVAKYGKTTDLTSPLNDVWATLFEPEKQAIKTLPFYHPEKEKQADKNATFLHLECNSKKVAQRVENTEGLNATFLQTKEEQMKETNTPPNRAKIAQCKHAPKRCKTCGKDISHQHEKSIFCSEARTGKAGKRCRNKDSNRRLNIRRMISWAINKPDYLQITYTDETGRTFTDTLHPTEVTMKKSLLDRIVNIKKIYHSQTQSNETATAKEPNRKRKAGKESKVLPNESRRDKQ
jgi:hypothetical protein